MEDIEKLTKQVKSLIRSQILSAPEGIMMNRFVADYMEFNGDPPPIKKLGFATYLELLESIPDVVRIVCLPNGSKILKGVANKDTAHIQEMIAKQKDSNTGTARSVKRAKQAAYSGYGGNRFRSSQSSWQVPARPNPSSLVWPAQPLYPPHKRPLLGAPVQPLMKKLPALLSWSHTIPHSFKRAPTGIPSIDWPGIESSFCNTKQPKQQQFSNYSSTSISHNSTATPIFRPVYNSNKEPTSQASILSTNLNTKPSFAQPPSQGSAKSPIDVKEVSESDASKAQPLLKLPPDHSLLRSTRLLGKRSMNSFISLITETAEKGINLSEIPEAYQRRFGLVFNSEDFGFKTTYLMVEDCKEIFDTYEVYDGEDLCVRLHRPGSETDSGKIGVEKAECSEPNCETEDTNCTAAIGASNVCSWDDEIISETGDPNSTVAVTESNICSTASQSPELQQEFEIPLAEEDNVSNDSPCPASESDGACFGGSVLEKMKVLLQQHSTGIWASELFGKFENGVPNEVKENWAKNLDSETRKIFSVQPSIPFSIRTKVTTFLEAYPGGIRSVDFIASYEWHTNLKLDTTNFGFDCVEAFLIELQESKILTLLCERSGIYVYPYRSAPAPEVPNRYVVIDATEVKSVAEPVVDAFPNEAVTPRDHFMSVALPKLQDKSGGDANERLQVYIVEVYSPWRFYVQLAPSTKLDKLMKELGEFYNGPEGVKYKLISGRDILVEGQVCVASYGDQWHRGFVATIKDDKYKIYYVDFGTKASCDKEKIRLMHRSFLGLPTQAIRARLRGVKPAKGAEKWDMKANIFFRDSVPMDGTPAHAVIKKTDEENHCIEIDLYRFPLVKDENVSKNQYFKEVLIQMGHADVKLEPDQIPSLPLQKIFQDDKQVNPSPPKPTVSIAPTLKPRASFPPNRQSTRWPQFPNGPIHPNQQTFNAMPMGYPAARMYHPSVFASGAMNSMIPTLATTTVISPLVYSPYHALMQATQPMMSPAQSYMVNQGMAAQIDFQQALNQQSMAMATNMLPNNIRNPHQSRSSNAYKKVTINKPVQQKPPVTNYNPVLTSEVPSLLAQLSETSQLPEPVELPLVEPKSPVPQVRSPISDMDDLLDLDLDDALEVLCGDIDDCDLYDPRFFMPVDLPGNHRVHITNLKQSPYLISTEISALIPEFQGDELEQQLEEIKANMRNLKIKRENFPAFFAEMERLNVPGWYDRINRCPVEVVTLYSMCYMNEIFARFSVKDSELKTALNIQMLSFDADKPYWKL